MAFVILGGILGGEFSCSDVEPLVAPYCAIPRDYLSDTPLLRAVGFLGSQHGQSGAIPPPPSLRFSPVESMQSGGADTPPQKGYLSDTCAIPYENKANRCDTPLCDTISKGYCATWGVSRIGPLGLSPPHHTISLMRSQAEGLQNRCFACSWGEHWHVEKKAP